MKFDKFLADDAVVTGDIATNTAGASGDTSQTKKKNKQKSKICRRLSENTIKFTINHEKSAEKIADLQEKYPDAVFTYTLNQDIIGETSGSGIIEVNDIWYNDIKTIMTDSKYFDLSS